MPIYVDTMFMLAKVGRLRARWCHLIGDTEEELHAFAQRIGLKRTWFQDRGMSHYDLTEKRRAMAIEAGAQEINRRELVAKVRAYRQGKFRP